MNKSALFICATLGLTTSISAFSAGTSLVSPDSVRFIKTEGWSYHGLEIYAGGNGGRNSYKMHLTMDGLSDVQQTKIIRYLNSLQKTAHLHGCQIQAKSTSGSRVDLQQDNEDYSSDFVSTYLDLDETTCKTPLSVILPQASNLVRPSAQTAAPLLQIKYVLPKALSYVYFNDGKNIALTVDLGSNGVRTFEMRQDPGFAYLDTTTEALDTMIDKAKNLGCKIRLIDGQFGGALSFPETRVLRIAEHTCKTPSGSGDVGLSYGGIGSSYKNDARVLQWKMENQVRKGSGTPIFP